MKPDLSLVRDAVAPIIIDAAYAASDALTSRGIVHAIIGGLAVGAYGYARATKDVDFLVSENAFNHHRGGIVTLKSGVPIEVNGVRIDLLSNAAVREELETPSQSERLPFVSVEALIFLKLLAFRRRDQLDIVELLRAGIDDSVARGFVQRHGGTLSTLWLDRFDTLLSRLDSGAE